MPTLKSLILFNASFLKLFASWLFDLARFSHARSIGVGLRGVNLVGSIGPSIEQAGWPFRTNAVNVAQVGLAGGCEKVKWL